MPQPHADNPEPLDAKLTGQHVEMILQQVQSIPTLPEVATRLLNLTLSNRSHTQEVIDLVRSDQSLTAHILSLASRGPTGIRKEIRTIDKAVLMLGFETVRAAVLSVKVFEMFGPTDESPTGLDRREFWKHCLAVASAAELLARRSTVRVDPEELFTCGLLHDIGKLALEQILPKSYARVVQACDSHYGNIAEYERRIIGVDHTIVGRRLARQWRLPEFIEHAIWLHHQPVDGLPEMVSGRAMIALIHLADTIAREQRFGYSGNFTFPAGSARLAAQIGLSPAAVSETVKRLPDMIEQRGRMLGLNETTSESLYRTALANANQELGRLNERLSRRAAQTASQTRAFEVLGKFSAALTGRETLGRLCEQVARTWARMAQTTPSQSDPVGAYILSVGDSQIVLATCTGDEPAQTELLATAINLPPESVPAGANSGSDLFARLLADPDKIPPALKANPPAHLPLTCGHQWVGGILWSPKTASVDPAGLAEKTVAATLAFAVASTELRARANALSEELALASRNLYSTQKALTVARSLAAVGEMAAGAAHEINNPLAVIAGRAQLMAESATGANGETWAMISKQADKISDIITEMMEFARPPEPNLAAVPVRAIIDRAMEAVASLEDAQRLKFQIQVAPDTPPVWVDERQIADVVTELITNAAEACAVDPRIRIEAAFDDTTSMVLLRVADNGNGMDAETLENAFTPFFSAHPAGRKRGLGLAKARRVVQLIGGKIHLASARGEGTTAFVQLPPATDAGDEQTPEEDVS